MAKPRVNNSGVVPKHSLVKLLSFVEQESEVIAFLERLSVKQAMGLPYGHTITVTSKDGDVRQYQLLRYSGYDRMSGHHIFLVRVPGGTLATRSDYQLGLAGSHATARFAEPIDNELDASA